MYVAVVAVTRFEGYVPSTHRRQQTTICQLAYLWVFFRSTYFYVGQFCSLVKDREQVRIIFNAVLSLFLYYRTGAINRAYTKAAFEPQ